MGEPMKIAAAIPSRYASTRFPGKPLALILGRPMIVHVCERVAEASRIDTLWVATDDERIAAVVRAAGYEARMTPPDCPSGSDRIVASLRPGEDWSMIVNIQGDEPRIHPSVIDATVGALESATDCGVGTAAVPIRQRSEFESPHVVKVVLAQSGRALYFSRSPLPSPARLEASHLGETNFTWGLKHLGLYAFRPEALLAFARLEPTPLEVRERLEQLRILEHGIGIVVATVEHDSIGIDTPEQLARLNAGRASSQASEVLR